MKQEKERARICNLLRWPPERNFKCLFANPKDAKNLRWHATERRCDGLLRHPADLMQSKNIDQQFPKFSE